MNQLAMLKLCCCVTLKRLGGKSWSTCWHICSNIVTFSPIYPKAQFAWYSNCIAVWSLCAKSRCWWHRCTQRVCNICYQAARGTKLLWNTHFRWKALALSARITVAFGKGKENLPQDRSEEHTSELQSHVRISYAVFCLKKKKKKKNTNWKLSRLVAHTDGLPVTDISP